MNIFQNCVGTAYNIYIHGHMMSLVKKTKNNLLKPFVAIEKYEKFTLVSTVSIGHIFFVCVKAHITHR